MKKLLDLCMDALEHVRDKTTSIADALNKAYDANIEANGHITSAALISMLNDLKDNMLSEVS
eukprot:179951-Ditylum_brightwellii.AAC.1